jgi:hypothetical protein
MIRWCKLRLKLNPMTWLEPLQECFAIGLGASFAVNYLFNWNSLVFFMIHVLCWFLSDYTLLTTAQLYIFYSLVFFFVYFVFFSKEFKILNKCKI